MPTLVILVHAFRIAENRFHQGIVPLGVPVRVRILAFPPVLHASTSIGSPKSRSLHWLSSPERLAPLPSRRSSVHEHVPVPACIIRLERSLQSAAASAAAAFSFF